MFHLPDALLIVKPRLQRVFLLHQDPFALLPPIKQELSVKRGKHSAVIEQHQNKHKHTEKRVLRALCNIRRKLHHNHQQDIIQHSHPRKDCPPLFYRILQLQIRLPQIPPRQIFQQRKSNQTAYKHQHILSSAKIKIQQICDRHDPEADSVRQTERKQEPKTLVCTHHIEKEKAGYGTGKQKRL